MSNQFPISLSVTLKIENKLAESKLEIFLILLKNQIGKQTILGDEGFKDVSEKGQYTINSTIIGRFSSEY